MSENELYLKRSDVRVMLIQGNHASLLHMVDQMAPLNAEDIRGYAPQVLASGEMRVLCRLAWNGWTDSEHSRNIIAEHEARDTPSRDAWDRVIAALDAATRSAPAAGCPLPSGEVGPAVMQNYAEAGDASAPDFLATHNSGERLPSSDAAGAGADAMSRSAAMTKSALAPRSSLHSGESDPAVTLDQAGAGTTSPEPVSSPEIPDNSNCSKSSNGSPEPDAVREALDAVFRDHYWDSFEAEKTLILQHVKEVLDYSFRYMPALSRPAHGEDIKEACAQIAEKQALQWVNGEPTTAIGQAYQRACRESAAAIRALFVPADKAWPTREQIAKLIERECYIAGAGDDFYVSGIEQAAETIAALARNDRATSQPNTGEAS